MLHNEPRIIHYAWAHWTDTPEQIAFAESFNGAWVKWGNGAVEIGGCDQTPIGRRNARLLLETVFGGYPHRLM